LRTIIAAITLMLLGFGAGAAAQLSPHDHTMATIGTAELSITYGRPSMRGRKIVGALVPYNHWWCPGADEATELHTSRGLRFADKVIPAGGYTLYILPTAGDWTLMINKETGLFHTQYHPASDIAHLKMIKREVTPAVEELTFAIEPNAANAGGAIVMTWENTSVSVPFTIESRD